MTRYITQYESCSLIFLIIIAIRFFGMKKYPNKQNAWFGYILICAIIDIVLDVVSAYAISYPEALPLWANYLVNSVFYICQASLPMFLLVYVFCLCRVKITLKRSIAFIPAAASILLVIINLFTTTVFYFQKVDDKIIYEHGDFFGCMYAICVFYLIMSVVVVLKHRQYLRKTEERTIIAFVAIIITMLLIQIALPHILLTGVAITIAIFLMYLTMQNPESMLDVVSHVFNYGAMKDYFRFQSEKQRVWLTIIDVGGVRRINSTLGLHAGNTILRQVGDYLDKLISGKAIVFQLVGTKFLILSKDQQGHNDITKQVQSRFRKPWLFGSTEVMLIATIRYTEEAACFASSDDIDNLVDVAYSKIAGNDIGTIRAIDSETITQSKRYTDVVDAIKRALDNNESFSLCYQPIYSVDDKKFASAEVLLRMTDPILGKISPNEFIPIAEKAGLVNQIDNIVLRKVGQFIEQHPELFDKGLKLFEVNLSAAEFYYDYMPLVFTILEQYKSTKYKICFEVTETAATTHTDILLSFMRKLGKEGFLFALDDFGTGYANISHLVQLPFSVAKIDKSFISSESEQDKIVLRDISAMFRDLGMKTVAEGVETRSQLDRVMSVGIDEIQGYLYSRPLTGDDFVEFINKNNF